MTHTTNFSKGGSNVLLYFVWGYLPISVRRHFHKLKQRFPCHLTGAGSH